MRANVANTVYNLDFTHCRTPGEKQMYQQTSLLFYRFRYVLACILTAIFLLIVSALVTALGSNTALDARTHTSANALDTSTLETPNTISAGATILAADVQHALLSAGSAMYSACRSVTAVTAQSGKSIAHGSATVVRGVGKGVGLVGRGIGSGVMFTLHTVSHSMLFILRMPAKIVGSVTSGHTVNDIIRPSDDRTVPVISTETSAAVLTAFNAEQRQKIAEWQAAQAEANRELGGTILAGDPNHGGYPAKWDNARQDSQLDSWGMYNRECVSYAAWKVYQTYGNMPYWGGVGNANQWIRDARAAGIATGPTPQAHAVAISMSGYYGHAMWVEKVSGDMIYVSQYNYDLRGHYSEMWLNGSYLTYIYFK